MVTREIIAAQVFNGTEKMGERFHEIYIRLHDITTNHLQLATNFTRKQHFSLEFSPFALLDSSGKLFRVEFSTST